MARILQFLRDHRKRLATFVMVAGLLIVGGQLVQADPREVEVELAIPDHERVTRVDVAYLETGELVRRVSLRFPDGAPSRVHDTVELAPGTYDVAVELGRDAAATVSLTGTLEAPADGVVRIALSEGAE